ncbi:bifunctional 2-polyprenyl-6-hydroxyphenol methylase/3-demethylubiquinol 3-O-methyltransferase UbiG [Arcobacter sp. LA11]|uniref:class I SAM-dependent methyltransferase n=1 Tax=Arcobacter sp. LA11 TaxID=1898176 RepID=UPI00093383C7|nr:class I SAM-dependent methyltransferase [Arcobacter sp. LA11]
MGLELYARVEEYLNFQDEVKELHSTFLGLIFEKGLDDIIDIGCGQGTFMMHLLANGVNAYGIDLSVEQIKVCQAYNLNADAISLDKVNEKFNCATAIFDVINYIPKNELKQFFKDASSVLNDNGYFIFDINSLFGFEEVAQGSLNIKDEDRFIAIDAIFENEELKTDITLFSKTKNNLYEKEADTITQYYHDIQFLKNIIIDSGFKLEEIINFNLHTDEEADKLIFICKK